MNWEMVSAICAVIALLNLGVGAYLRLFLAREFAKFANAIKEEYISKEVFELRMQLQQNQLDDIRKRVTKP